MRFFVFRNTTVEYLFQGIDAAFSGYSDTSLPANASSFSAFVFFYCVPVKVDRNKLRAEIESYLETVKRLSEALPQPSRLLVFTLHQFTRDRLLESDFSVELAISAFNRGIVSLAEGRSQIRLLDIGDFFQTHPESKLIDWKYYFLYDAIINPALNNAFKAWFEERLRKMDFIRRKCLIIDLDNTIWGGIIGEDGPENLQLGSTYPGNVFVHFQQMIRHLKDVGVMLAICSRNNEDDVRPVFEGHPGMVLRWSDFVVRKINWEDKAQNIREIAGELNISTDSLVFIDDSPHERALVQRELEDVLVPEFPAKPHEIPRCFAAVFKEHFAVYELTPEDLGKTDHYRRTLASRELAGRAGSHEEFLRELKIRIIFSELKDHRTLAEQATLKRIAQLCQKTNQFNLTTRRYSETDLCRMISGDSKPRSRIFHVSVEDRFGEYGIVGCCIVKYLGGDLFPDELREPVFSDANPDVTKESSAEIDSFLLSCRVLGKGIETVVLRLLLNSLFREGIRTVVGTCIPTSRNQPAHHFLEKAGFEVSERSDERWNYLLRLEDCLAVSDLYEILVP